MKGHYGYDHEEVHFAGVSVVIRNLFCTCAYLCSLSTNGAQSFQAPHIMSKVFYGVAGNTNGLK